MTKRGAKKAAVVREPVQVYLAADDSALLGRLSDELGLSKAEVLRQGVRSLARERGVASPMMEFIDGLDAKGWPARVGDRLDDVLAESYLAPAKKAR